GVLSKADEDPARGSEGTKRGGTVSGKLTLRHAFSHAFACRFVSRDRDVVGDLHQRDFSGRFEHATTGRNRIRTHKLHSRRDLTNAVIQKETHTFLNADRACAHTAILEYLC